MIKSMAGSIKHLLWLIALAIAVASLTLLFAPRPAAKAQTSNYFTGYAWSENIGWIHMSGPGYGVQEDVTSGALSGYAWSNIGWLSFNSSETANCPSGSCAPTVNLNTGAVSGWARACAVFQNKNACSGTVDPQAGGWDGWVHLAGSNYGMQIGNASTSYAASGYSWGDTGVGWIHWAGTGYGVSAPSAAWGVLVGYVHASPSTITPGGTTNIAWSCANATSAKLRYPIGGVATTTSVALSGSFNDTPSQSTLYSLTCYGNGNSGTYSSNALVSVQAASNAILVTLVGNPASVRTGETTQIVWNVNNMTANSCSIAQQGGGWSQSVSNPASGSGTVTTPVITQSTTFTMTCTGSDSSTQTGSITIGVLPTFHEI